jgi:hypothetical protein
VSEHLRRVRRGVRGGAGPPLGGCRGGKRPRIFFVRADIFPPGRHISGTTYFRDDIFSGPHDIRWFFRHMVFCRWFSISG